MHGVHVDSLLTSHSVTVLTRPLLSSLWFSKPEKAKKLISACASRQRMHLFATVPTNCNVMVRKVLKWALTILLVFLAILIYFKYFYTYSDGYRAGLLQKFSHKGSIFKTYEGEMILSSVSSSRDVPLASEKFSFTMTNKSLVRSFDTLQGSTVIVHYRQKNKAVFWRGDSPYLVDSVRIKR